LYSFDTFRDAMSFRYFHAIADVLKDKKTNRRGEIGVLACPVDLCNQFRQRHLLGMRDFFQVIPEGIFKADAGLVSTNGDRAFDDCGFPSAP
jgi:hypothetical protein